MIAHKNPVSHKPARVVLLGARGFIGAALRLQLEAQDIAVLAPASAELDLAAADASDKLAALLAPTDAVVMLAALTPDKGRDAATLMKNLAMMQNLCAALEKTGCSHLVYFSSDAVYNIAASSVTDETPASPQDLYGAMHWTREIMARGLQNIPVLVLRPTMVYGLEDTHNAYGPNRFRRMAAKEGRITLFGEGEETRDHIHVDDVAALTLLCLHRRSTGVLNIATGSSHSFYAVAELVAKHSSNVVGVVKTPRVNPVTHRHYDVTGLIKAFPDFRFIPLEAGIERMQRKSLENA